MNGLEAIELMKQGKVVIEVKDTASEPFIFKIIGGNVCFKYPDDDENEYQVDDAFDFTATYAEYVESLTGWHVKGKYMDFWMMRGDGDVEDEEYCYEDDYRDEDRFSTKEKAEEIAFKQTLFRKLQRFSDENGGNEIDWNDGERFKFAIYYDCKDKEVRVATYEYMNCFGGVYFISHEIAKKAIELFHDDLIKYFTM